MFLPQLIFNILKQFVLAQLKADVLAVLLAECIKHLLRVCQNMLRGSKTCFFVFFQNTQCMFIRAISADRSEQDCLRACQINAIENAQVKALVETRVNHHKVTLGLLLCLSDKGKTDQLHVCVIDVP
jgi:hypothetical protein